MTDIDVIYDGEKCGEIEYHSTDSVENNVPRDHPAYPEVKRVVYKINSGNADISGGIMPQVMEQPEDEDLHLFADEEVEPDRKDVELYIQDELDGVSIYGPYIR